MSEPEQDGWEEVLPFPEVYIKVEPQEAEMKVGTSGTGHLEAKLCALCLVLVVLLGRCSSKS